MSRKYFGTDGIRGTVGEYPICPEFMLNLGYATGKVLGKSHHGKVVIGKDTRISGYMFESVLEAGFSAAGMDVLLLGPMPTPAIAYLTRTFRADVGIVVSASHNSYTDNGVKFFDSTGGKLADEIELEIENELDKQKIRVVAPDKLGKAVRIDDAPGRYVEFCKRTIPGGMLLKGLKLVVDCSNGATYHVSPKVFEELGAEVVPINVKPDGLNINRDCGSTHPEGLRQAVLEQAADVGIAFDGDGDRVMMVDHKGELVDGDEIIYIIATDRQARNKLKGSVVGTLMTNLGLEHALKKTGINLIRADVGDRYVMEQLLATGSSLGGENSGHIICLDRTTTGDGTVSALQVLAVMIRTGKSLHDLKSGMEKYPQVLLNVKVNKRVPLDTHNEIQQILKQAESELKDCGRVLLRYSGTEPLIRVMVEGSDGKQVKIQAETIAAAVAQNLAP